MEQITMKQSALNCAAKGIPVFPVVPKQDTTFGKWYDNATTIPQQIESRWTQNANLNVGIVTGIESGLVVLRFQTEEAFLAAEERGLPLTPVVKRDKGYDVYCKYPDNLDENTFDSERYPDISLFGEGKTVLVPPSVIAKHPPSVFYKPEVYAWREGRSLDDVPLADVPAWLFKVENAEVKSPVVVEDESTEVNVTNVVESVHITDVTPVEADSEPFVMVVPSTDNKPEPVINNWNAPKLFDRYHTEDIKADVLPSWLGDFAKAISESKKTPEGLAVMLGLSMIATCVQKKFVVAPYGDDEYTEQLALWTVTVLKSAERKSPILNAMREPLISWQKEQAELLKDQILTTSTSIHIAQKRIEKLSQDAVKHEDATERQNILDQITDIKRTMPTAVKVPVMWTSDVTPETLQDLLAENGERMSLLSDEGNIFEIMAGLYSEGKVNADIFLQAHSGSPAIIKRKTRDVDLKKPALTFGLAVQPVVIEAFANGSKKAFRGKGVMGRFLYCLPESMLGKRDSGDRVRVSEEVKARYQAGIKSLLSIPTPNEPEMLTLDDEAYEVWLAFDRRVEKTLAPGGELADMGDWGGKLTGHMLRIAGLMHLVEYGADSTVIGKSTMAKAVHLCELLIEHAKAAFGMAGEIEPHADAKKVFEWIKAGGFNAFTKTECHNHFKSKPWNKEKLDIALAELVKRNIIKHVQALTTGRSATSYISNPALK